MDHSAAVDTDIIETYRQAFLEDCLQVHSAYEVSHLVGTKAVVSKAHRGLLEGLQRRLEDAHVGSAFRFVPDSSEEGDDLTFIQQCYDAFTLALLVDPPLAGSDAHITLVTTLVVVLKDLHYQLRVFANDLVVIETAKHCNGGEPVAWCWANPGRTLGATPVSL